MFVKLTENEKYNDDSDYYEPYPKIIVKAVVAASAAASVVVVIAARHVSSSFLLYNMLCILMCENGITSKKPLPVKSKYYNTSGGLFFINS